MFALFLGVLGIGIRLNIGKDKLLLGAAGGVLSMIILNLFSAHIDETICIFLTAAGASVYSEIMARLKKTPVTIFLPTAITPILPGKAVYDAINLAMNADTQGFLTSGISIFYKAIAIALGIMVVRTLEVLISKLLKQISHLFTNRKQNS